MFDVLFSAHFDPAVSSLARSFACLLARFIACVLAGSSATVFSLFVFLYSCVGGWQAGCLMAHLSPFASGCSLVVIACPSCRLFGNSLTLSACLRFSRCFSAVCVCAYSFSWLERVTVLYVWASRDRRACHCAERKEPGTYSHLWLFCVFLGREKVVFQCRRRSSSFASWQQR